MPRRLRPVSCVNAREARFGVRRLDAALFTLRRMAWHRVWLSTLLE